VHAAALQEAAGRGPSRLSWTWPFVAGMRPMLCRGGGRIIFRRICRGLRSRVPGSLLVWDWEKICEMVELS
jgi:hypothetical protein